MISQKKEKKKKSVNYVIINSVNMTMSCIAMRVNTNICHLRCSKTLLNSDFILIILKHLATFGTDEPPDEKTNNLHMRNQTRRSASH